MVMHFPSLLSVWLKFLISFSRLQFLNIPSHSGARAIFAQLRRLLSPSLRMFAHRLCDGHGSPMPYGPDAQAQGPL